MIIVDRPNEADIGIVGSHGDGPIHAVPTGHQIAKFSRSNEGVPAGKGIGAAQINEQDPVVGLFGCQFFQPSDQPAGGVLVTGLGQGMHFIDLIQQRVRESL